MTTYLVMGLVVLTILAIVFVGISDVRGKVWYILSLGILGFICTWVAYSEQNSVGNILELYILLIFMAIGIIISRIVLDRTSVYVDELFKDEEKPESQGQTAEDQSQPKSSSESSNDKYVDLLKKAAKLSIFAVPFLLIVNISMQLVLPIFKTGKEAPNSVIEHLGTFGDFFGGTLNPVLTFATFIALIATILIQLKELRLTREELKNSNEQLKMSREEQAKTAKALQEQERTQRVQKFETTFFSLYDRIMSEQIRLQDVFSDAIDKVKFNSIKGKTESDFCEEIIRSNREISSFLILLYQAMKLVNSFSLGPRLAIEGAYLSDNEKKINEIETSDAKKKCINILRSSISNNVLYLIFLNCSKHNKSFGDDFVKYRSYVERFCFLEHLDLNEFLSKDSHEILSTLHNSGRNNVADRIEFLNNKNDTLRIFKSIYSDYSQAFGKSVYIDQFK